MGGWGGKEIKREGLQKSMQHGSTSEEKYLAGMWEGDLVMDDSSFGAH